ncbi:MAG: HEAT repeat domain-containing protein [Proteocatella sp.]
MDYLKESYNLYLKGKNISEISEMLKIEENLVQQHIINAKLSHSFSLNTNTNAKVNTSNVLEQFLVLDKNDRIAKLESLAPKSKALLIVELGKFLGEDARNAEDYMLVIWIIGELGIRDYNDYLKKLSFSYNGNIKRMVFSAMGKIYDEAFVPYLKQGCKDPKPQVRSYAIKAFAKYNTDDKLEFLRKVYKNETVDYNRKIILRAVKEGQ